MSMLLIYILVIQRIDLTSMLMIPIWLQVVPDTHPPMPKIIKDTQVNWRSSLICTIFQLIIHVFLARRFICDLKTLNMIKGYGSTCCNVYIRMTSLFISRHFEFLPPFWIYVSNKWSRFDFIITIDFIYLFSLPMELSSGAFSSKTSNNCIVLYYARHSTFLNCYLKKHLNLWKDYIIIFCKNQ